MLNEERKDQPELLNEESEYYDEESEYFSEVSEYENDFDSNRDEIKRASES